MSRRAERVGLLVSFAALGIWALSAVTFIGLLAPLAWGGGVGLYAWLLFALPFAAYVLVYAFRRWREPLPSGGRENDA